MKNPTANQLQPLERSLHVVVAHLTLGRLSDSWCHITQVGSLRHTQTPQSVTTEYESRCSCYTQSISHTRSGDRAFSVAADQTWKSLPPVVTTASTLSSFCPALKTHLLTASFPSSLWHYWYFELTVLGDPAVLWLCHRNHVRFYITLQDGKLTCCLKRSHSWPEQMPCCW